MRSAVASISVLAWTVSTFAQSPLYGQCGGQGWSGATTCASGSTCTYSNPYYSQCLPGGPTTTTTTTTKSTTTTTSTTTSKSTTTSSSTISTKSTTSTTPTTTTTTTTTTASTAPSTCPTSSGGSGTLTNTGVNIAGFDFGCDTTGTCIGSTAPPLVSLGGGDGQGQMTHFASDGMNTFRLPIGWQYLTPTLGGSLNTTEWNSYNTLVQSCLGTGAYCIVDIHNYARWNNAIIGQSSGAVTNAQFASLWSLIATQLKSYPKVVFGVMNEPHDIPNINAWATTVQAAVTAIRTAGATNQIILLPGNNWTSAQTFVSSGSANALANVRNLDGTITNLIFDVHKYLDSDNSGTHTDCVTDNVSSTWSPLASWLRCHGRQAIISETGGGNVADCVTYMCSQNKFIKQNSDVFLGWVGWAAGSFGSTYNLTETPTYSGGTWTDMLLVNQCMYQNSLA